MEIWQNGQRWAKPAQVKGESGLGAEPRGSGVVLKTVVRVCYMREDSIFNLKKKAPPLPSLYPKSRRKEMKEKTHKKRIHTREKL